jgi:2,5-diketo-D-gluconate reductase A
VGYRLVDTAQMYGNEDAVGRAITASGVARDELYVTTKLANSNHRAEDLRRSFDESLHALGLEYVDLFLIHWPLPMLYDGDYPGTWRAMTELVADGRVRTVGVSNFTSAQIDRIIDATGVVPAVNQVEMHPYFPDDATRSHARELGIAIQAWGPLGQGAVLADPTIVALAAAHGRTPGQVVLRWHFQREVVAIPSCDRRDLMLQNLDIFDFELSDDDLAAIASLDRGPEGRVGPHPDTFDWAGSRSPRREEARLPPSP